MYSNVNGRKIIAVDITCALGKKSPKAPKRTRSGIFITPASPNINAPCLAVAPFQTIMGIK